KHLNAVQAALRFVHEECPTEQPAAEDGPASTMDLSQAKKFGEMVAKGRRALGLSRAELAERAGLVEGTVRNAELAKNIPTNRTVLHLLGVKELGISAEQIPGLLPEGNARGSLPNCWIAPGYDPLKLFAELFALLNSRGGSVEQTFAYLDHKSATN